MEVPYINLFKSLYDVPVVNIMLKRENSRHSYYNEEQYQHPLFSILFEIGLEVLELVSKIRREKNKMIYIEKEGI